jgi:hypothetical protein
MKSESIAQTVQIITETLGIQGAFPGTEVGLRSLQAECKKAMAVAVANDDSEGSDAAADSIQMIEEELVLLASQETVAEEVVAEEVVAEEVVAEEVVAEEVVAEEVVVEEASEVVVAAKEKEIPREQKPSPAPRTTTVVFDRNTCAPAVARAKILGMEADFLPAFGLSVGVADIKETRKWSPKGRGQIENPVLPAQVLRDLGVAVADPSAFQSRVATYSVTADGRLRFNGAIGPDDRRPALRAMRAWMMAVIGNPSVPEGDHCLHIDSWDSEVTTTSNMSRVRKVTEDRGKGLNKVLGLPGMVEASLLRREKNTPGVHAAEYHSMAMHLRHDQEAVGEPQISVAPLWTEEDIARVAGIRSGGGYVAELSDIRMASLINATARSFAVYPGGGRVMQKFASALDRADRIFDPESPDYVRSAESLSAVFLEVASDLSKELGDYSARSVFPEIRAFYNRILRAKLGDSAFDKLLNTRFGGAREITADTASEALQESGDGLNDVAVRLLRDFVSEANSANLAMSGSLRLLRTYFSPRNSGGIPVWVGDWTTPTEKPITGFPIAPATWVAAVDTPVRVTKGASNQAFPAFLTVG